MHLPVAANGDPPLLHVTEDGDGSFSFKGPLKNLLDTLSSLLNFTYTLYVPPDGQYGGRFENGSWNGMIGEVVNGRADLALGALVFTEERYDVLDFCLDFHMIDLKMGNGV